IAVSLLAFCGTTSAFATTIVDALQPSSGAFWFGTYVSDPTPPFHFDIAQLIKTAANFQNVTAAVSLAVSGVAPVSVTLSVASTDKGAPGAVLASTSVAVTSSEVQTYFLNFGGLTLDADVPYWLVATSPTLWHYSGFGVCCDGSLPRWQISN